MWGGRNPTNRTHAPGGGDVKLCQLAAAAGLAAMLFHSPVTAGDFRLLVLDGSLTKWGTPRLGTGAEVTYAFVTRPTATKGARNCGVMDPFTELAGAAGLDRETLAAQAHEAFRAWEAVAQIRFRPAAREEDADILIGAQADPAGLAFANVALEEEGRQGSKANRRTIVNSKGDLGASLKQVAPRVASIRRSLICLNPERKWKVGFDGNLEVYDLRHTFTHEIGHAIGLDHPGPTGALMAFRYTESAPGLQSGDIEAARKLYGNRD